MAKTTAADIAHLIDFHLQHQAIRPSQRPFLLAYIASGYDQDGNRIQRATGLEARLKTLECEECPSARQGGPVCKGECPVKPFRDILGGNAESGQERRETTPRPPLGHGSFIGQQKGQFSHP